MTFEEFFTKKKIDLALLQHAKPDLYEEFHRHYIQMGEKSFDHTKKYWFNRLRKEYLLRETDTPLSKPISKSAVEKDPSSTPVTAAAKPVGFKPRFKATVTQDPLPEVTDPPPETQGENTPEKAATPTGFKPRFKAGTTPVTKPGVTETTPNTSTAKPLGFKPRFKAGVTGAAKPTAAEETKPDTSEGTSEPTSNPGTEKPLGFKPRFKAGNTVNKKNNNEGEA